MSRRDILSGLSRRLLDETLSALSGEDLLWYLEVALDRLLAGMTAAERTAFATRVVDAGFARLLQGLSPEEQSNLLDAVVAAALGQVMGGKEESSGEQQP